MAAIEEEMHDPEMQAKYPDVTSYRVNLRTQLAKKIFEFVKDSTGKRELKPRGFLQSLYTACTEPYLLQAEA